MGRHCKIVVLPEDFSHAALARGYFRERNVDVRAYEVDRKWTGRNGNQAAVIRWLREEAQLHSRLTGRRYGILALIDEDGQGLENRRQAVRTALNEFSLPGIDPNNGKCLILPMRNVETWMVWAARWKTAGGPRSPEGSARYETVSELDDYKRMHNSSGQKLAQEETMAPYLVGKVLAGLNAASPPAGTPPALRQALTHLGDFLAWCQL